MVAPKTFDTYADRLRKICLAFPGTDEVPSFGHPNWRVAGKMFAAIEERDGRIVFCFKETIPGQSLLVPTPGYAKSRYVGRFGWTDLALTPRSPWSVIAAHAERAWSLVAPSRLAKTQAPPGKGRGKSKAPGSNLRSTRPKSG